MLTPLELHARFPLVIGAQQPGAVMGDGRFGSRANDRQRAELCGAPLEIFVPVSSWLGVVDRLCSGRRLASRRNVRRERPTACWTTSMRQVAEGHSWHRRVSAQCRFERSRQRWLLRVDPPLVVKAVIQLPARRWLPRELREHLVLLVGPRMVRVRARLTVVVAQILVSAEEPRRSRTTGPPRFVVKSR